MSIWNREFLPHLREMSGNAVKLYLFLHLSAHRRSGPKRGCVEANVEDIMDGLGWTRSMVNRSLKELASKRYVSFHGGANQHSPRLIRVNEFDAKEHSSAELNGDTRDADPAQLTSEISNRDPDHLTDDTSERDSADVTCDTSEQDSAQFTHDTSTDEGAHLTGDTSNTSGSQGQRDLQALGITSLPARHADFVALANESPRSADESLYAWCRRIVDLSTEMNIFLPRRFYACARQAAA